MRLIGIFLILFTGLAWSQTDSGQAVYSNASLKGAYGFLVNAWLSSPSDSPTGNLGVLDFDGAGHLTISVTINEAGIHVGSFTGTGTYSVAKNGTGTLHVLIPRIYNITSTIVLDSGGESFKILVTSCTTYCQTGVDVSTGTAIAMGASSFSNAGLDGSYQWDMEKWTSSTSPIAQILLATATFDGIRKVTLSGTERTGGTVSTYSASGTYSVSTNGSGSMEMPDKSGDTFTISFVLNSAATTGLGATGVQHMLTAYSGDFGGYVNDSTATKQ
jgi:hypothetical protein